MADYLLDTNHLSTMVTEKHPVRLRIQRQLRFGDTFAIATPTLTEMLYGIQMLPRARRNVADWQQLSVMFDYYAIERSDAEQAATLQVILRHQGWQLATVDALMAAIALRYDLVLLTADNDFNRVAGLRYENWFSNPA
jgi:tRNA(fMet)-specific endonuclease VapC